MNIAYKISENDNLPLVYEYLQEAEEKKLELVCHHDKNETRKIPTHVFILEIEQIQAAIVIETQNPLLANKAKQEKTV